MKVTPGKLERLRKVLEDWDGGSVDGAIATYVYTSDKDINEVVFTVLFRDVEAHNANARNPVTADWFQAVRANLDSDPEWTEGEVIVARQY
jgi:quinol monooxygenase YgiN